MEDARKFRRGTKRDVLGYFYDHADRDVTAAELEKHFSGTWTRNQIMQAVGDILRTNAAPVKKVVSGVWRLVEVKESTGKNTLTVEVIKETDEATIGVDDSGNVYKFFLLG